MFSVLSLIVGVGLMGLWAWNDDDSSDGGEDDMPPEMPPEPDTPTPPSDSFIRITGDDNDNVITDEDSTQNILIRSLGGDDTIDLDGTGDDVIYAGDGDDDVSSGDGDDTVYLGKGNDFFGDIGGRNDPDFGGNDFVRGGGGNDQMISLAGSDTFYGDTGADIVQTTDVLPQFDGVEARPDLAFGGAGNDTMIFDDGDTVTGGTGVDSFELSIASTNATAVTITDYDPATETLELQFAGANPLLPESDFEERPTFDDLVITQNGDDTLMVYDGQLLAILKNTDVDEVRFSNIQVAG